MRQASVQGREHRAVGGEHGPVLSLGVARDAEEVGAVGLHAGGLVGARVASAALDGALALGPDPVGEVAAALALEGAIGALAARVADLRSAGGPEGGEGPEGNCDEGAHENAGTIHHLAPGVLWPGSEPDASRSGPGFRAKLGAPVSSELEDILAAFSRLVAEHEASREEGPEEEDPENFRCTDCVDCVSCRFCTYCERCSNCTYCDACSDCAGCTQSRECIACADCSQSNLSAYCEKSSYLTLCLDCDGCIQCFACVGLSGAEFHILNEPYKRSAYFKRVAELRKLLDVKLTEGWMPPWSAEPLEEPTPLPPPPAARTVAPEEPVPAPEEPVPAPEDPVPDPEETVPDPEDTLTGDPSTQVGERGAPRRVDPYTDRTSRLPDVPVVIETTGSWPPVDARSARSMDRETVSNEPWEELFEPDELPPPRPRARRPERPSGEPQAPPPPPPEAPPKAPRPGRFDRLVTPRELDREPEPAKPAEPPPAFMGRVPSPQDPPSDPESTGSIRRAKRPRRS